MAHDNSNSANGFDSEGLKPQEKTYTPLVTNGNYQPVIPIAAYRKQPAPPVGDSGVPAARNGPSPVPSASNNSSDGK